MKKSALKAHLDALVEEYASPDFILSDPVQVPHAFSVKQDIEIAGFIAAIFAWGQRKTICAKAKDFISRMEDDPYHFVLGYDDRYRKRFEDFKHRTFNGIDAHAVLAWLHVVYSEASDMEEYLFYEMEHPTAYSALVRIRTTFEQQPMTPQRSLKHIADPRKGSACKRINMFFRWMVRPDTEGVDFGLWTKLTPAQLIMPLDVHVLRTAYELGLIDRVKGDWQTARLLTDRLSIFDPQDPVRYDYALFAYGVG